MSNFIGVPRLGYKEAIAQADQTLGDEYIVMDVEDASLIDLKRGVSDRPVHVRWVKNNGATALVPGTVVKRDVAGDMAHDVVAITGAGQVGCGIVDPFLTSNVAQDEKFLIIFKGPVDCVSDSALTVGDTAGVSADGQVAVNAYSTVADTKHAFGVVMETVGGAGLDVRVDVDFRTL